MPEFHRASQQRVNAFPVGETYLFKHYFDDGDVFGELRQYYNGEQYRFEVPGSEFDRIRSSLAEKGYALVVVEDVEAYLVAVEKYTEHPDSIFQDSVLHGGDPEYNVFLLKDRAAVEQAVRNGATRFDETAARNPL